MSLIFSLIVLCGFLTISFGRTVDFERKGGIPFKNDLDTGVKNTALLNELLSNIGNGDTLYFPDRTFHFQGGVFAENIGNFIFKVDGTIKFLDDRDTWPRDAAGNVQECILLKNIENITFTSSTKGTLDGNGKKWWGAIDFLRFQEDRPRLFHVITSKNIVVENLLFKDSPYWTFYAENCDGLIVRYSDVDVRWDKKEFHSLLDLQAFNTDGFDVTGKNVYMHDLNIWNDDDCISVKDGSENMLFERVNASGVGLVIGSIGASQVRNITFRDSVMYNTFKGIYLKTRWSDSGPVGLSASITNILYENITMYRPEQWSIWMGPAQQTGQPCSLLWPNVPKATCDITGFQIWENITLKDITIYDPVHSPGVLMGNLSNPMKNVIFDNVVVVNPGEKPWGPTYNDCDGIEGIARGKTWPIPPCFKDETTHAA